MRHITKLAKDEKASRAFSVIAQQERQQIQIGSQFLVVQFHTGLLRISPLPLQGLYRLVHSLLFAKWYVFLGENVIQNFNFGFYRFHSALQLSFYCITIYVGS